jgi:predicted molibdopterin-dependent oxidoreductase YjgC
MYLKDILTNRQFQKVKRIQFKIMLKMWKQFKLDCPVPNFNNCALDDFDNAIKRLHNNYKDWWKKA